MRTLPSALLLSGLLIAATTHAADDDFKLEPGFKLLFNGKDLTGWKTKKGDALEGKAEAYDKRFTVTGGKIVIDPKVKGDVRITTVGELGGDLHIKLDYLPGPGCNNDIFLRGQKFDLVKSNVKNLQEGKWNELEIIVQGNKAEFKNNGETVRTGAAKPEATILEIRAEFGTVEFRRIRIKGPA